MTDTRPPTLYITRTGLLEPLGQSQVMAYLRDLSTDHRITLVTFEKQADLADAPAIARARAECEAHGIRWLPQRFRRRPRLIAPALGMARLLWLCLREVRRDNAALIHARSYLPSAVALAVKRLTGTPFIFDMRALWPEELITAGRLRRGSPVHRAVVRAETACLREAAAVVSLTRAAVDHLRGTRPGLDRQRIEVIPTCADLDRFTPPRDAPSGPPVYSCVGTVTSGWFRADMLVALFAEFASRSPDARFEIVTRDDPERVRALFAAAPDILPRLDIYALNPEQMPDALRRHTMSAMFYAGGQVSELGRSPTRLGEVLGCGLPVVANSGVGDLAETLTSHNVGVLMRDASPDSAGEAVDRLHALMRDEALRGRCRAAAEAVYSLHAGSSRYREIYRHVLAGQARQTPGAAETGKPDCETPR